ncbi:hypothetical protein J1N35_030132 [Gossypium stocksii]|uniref:Uncharacterized protein n=1 Tax=Gossypium stocksii TaxID=47602 RepID=A0A9D3UYY7_9ROSI|nr:hypothetical protein J1N35_030132 [Gossypium stocksii]
MAWVGLAIRTIDPMPNLLFFLIDRCLPRLVVRMTSHMGCNIPRLGVHTLSLMLPMGWPRPLVGCLNNLPPWSRHHRLGIRMFGWCDNQFDCY